MWITDRRIYIALCSIELTNLAKSTNVKYLNVSRAINLINIDFDNWHNSKIIDIDFHIWYIQIIIYNSLFWYLHAFFLKLQKTKLLKIEPCTLICPHFCMPYLIPESLVWIALLPPELIENALSKLAIGQRGRSRSAAHFSSGYLLVDHKALVNVFFLRARRQCLRGFSNWSLTPAQWFTNVCKKQKKTGFEPVYPQGSKARTAQELIKQTLSEPFLKFRMFPFFLNLTAI